MVKASTVRDDTLEWLLEDDGSGARYLALRDLLKLRPADPELVCARSDAHRNGPIAVILGKMEGEGFWAKAGPGYGPKYFSTVWSIVTLAQLGASASEDERIARACAYILDHALTPDGHWSMGGPGAPADTIDCLQGNLCWALMEMGYDDPRLGAAYEWMARTVTGDGIAPKTDKNATPRYYAGKCGSNFACGANANLPCAWGAVKVMLALARWPAKRRTQLMKRAIERGAAFLLGVDPATAAYPTGYTGKPSGNWWKLGFPVFYITDLLQNVEALAAAGYGADPRLANALQAIRQKQTPDGRWLLEYDYTGKTWTSFGAKGKPNKWVTLRALRALSMCPSVN